ncbi:hypothetical protein [Parahalioglobus pacificus]|uniref:hypothetical protein n=1 Tax=Parahalioglobus pacificus TaxID=930806 RepID=UPI001675C5A7|nr:hypothetical protein [Halioglobus pacificus]
MYRAIFGAAGVAAMVLVSPEAAVAHGHHDKWQTCKRAVMTETREFESVPMAAFSQNGHHHSNLLWTIHWDGQTATGSCKFDDHRFEGVEVQHHLKYSSHHHKHHKDSENYRGRYGGFYHDRHIGIWRDPDGEACHTCTPENGFPRHGG